jgi:hypothetical protein
MTQQRGTAARSGSRPRAPRGRVAEASVVAELHAFLPWLVGRAPPPPSSTKTAMNTSGRTNQCRKTLAHLPAPAAPANLRHTTRRPTRTSHMRTHTVRRASRRHLTTTLALLLAASA